jgi:hypothetical protein
VRRLNGVCVPVHTSSRSPSHRASDACGSIIACWAPATRNVRSTTASHELQTASGSSPCRIRNLWQTFVPDWGRMSKYAASFSDTAAASCTSTAPGSAASTGSYTAGSSS